MADRRIKDLDQSASVVESGRLVVDGTTFTEAEYITVEDLSTKIQADTVSGSDLIENYTLTEDLDTDGYDVTNLPYEYSPRNHGIITAGTITFNDSTHEFTVDDILYVYNGLGGFASISGATVLSVPTARSLVVEMSDTGTTTVSHALDDESWAISSDLGNKDTYNILARTGSAYSGPLWDLYISQQTLNLIGQVNPRGGYYVSTAAAVTIATGTPMAIGGTTTANASYLQDFTHTSNKLTYTGTDTAWFHMEGYVSMTTTINNVIISLYIAINGTVIAGSEIQRKVGTGADVGSANVQANFQLSTNDYVQVYVDSDTNTNFTAPKMTAHIAKE